MTFRIPAAPRRRVEPCRGACTRPGAVEPSRIAALQHCRGAWSTRRRRRRLESTPHCSNAAARACGRAAARSNGNARARSGGDGSLRHRVVAAWLLSHGLCQSGVSHATVCVGRPVARCQSGFVSVSLTVGAGLRVRGRAGRAALLRCCMAAPRAERAGLRCKVGSGGYAKSGVRGMQIVERAARHTMQA